MDMTDLQMRVVHAQPMVQYNGALFRSGTKWLVIKNVENIMARSAVLRDICIINSPRITAKSYYLFKLLMKQRLIFLKDSAKIIYLTKYYNDIYFLWLKNLLYYINTIWLYNIFHGTEKQNFKALRCSSTYETK